jgi:hypothetical protein
MLNYVLQHPDAPEAVAAAEKENEKTEAETSTPDEVESLCDAEVNVPTNSAAVSGQEFQHKTKEREKQADQEVTSKILTQNEEAEEEEENQDGEGEEKPSEPDSNNSEHGPVLEVESSSPKPDQSEDNKTGAVGVCSDADGTGREQETEGKVSHFQLH